MKKILKFFGFLIVGIALSIQMMGNSVKAESDDSNLGVTTTYDFTSFELISSYTQDVIRTTDSKDFYLSYGYKNKLVGAVRIGTNVAYKDHLDKFGFDENIDGNYLETRFSSQNVTEISFSYANVKYGTISSWYIMYSTDDGVSYTSAASGSDLTSMSYTFSSPVSGKFALVITGTTPRVDINSMSITTLPASFDNYDTKSSLWITYTAEENDFDVTETRIRFGVRIHEDIYSAGSSYGVLVVPSSLVSGTIESYYTSGTLADFISTMTSSSINLKKIDCTTNVAKVDEDGNASDSGKYYQFSGVLTNLEGYYDRELVAVTYIESDTGVVFANEAKYSINSLAQYYLDNELVNDAEAEDLLQAINTFKVTYNLDGGTNYVTNPTSFVYGNEVISLSDPIKSGSQFDGWYLDSEFTQSVTSIAANTNKNITLYAKFTASAYDEISFHFMELGNKYAGDAIYIKAGDNDILIDAGSRSSSATTLEAYMDQYVEDNTLEYVIATHAHQDHIAAFVSTASTEGIFEYYDCETIIDFPMTEATSQIYTNYCTARDAEVTAGATHYTALECRNETNGASTTYSLGNGLSMTILDNYYYTHDASSENDYSVCVMFTQGDSNFLFTGDLEAAGEEHFIELNDLPEVVLFKAGHHGSYTASSQALLNVISPEYCVVTCVAGTDEYSDVVNNQFPSQQFITNICQYTDKVYVTSMYDAETDFTSMNGNIVITASTSGTISLACSNNTTKLKDTEWFIANRVWE